MDLLALGDKGITTYSVTMFKPSPWNYNSMSAREYAQLKSDLEATQRLRNKIIARRHKRNYYEIIDGEHRLRALIELGYGDLDDSHVEIVEMSDKEVRQYIRSGKIRGSKVDLIKEAEHYLVDFNEVKESIEDITLTDYAYSIGVDPAKVSKILNRNNTNLEEKKIISNTTLSAEVVDEILRATPRFRSAYLREAEINNWTTEVARERMRTDETEGGDPVVRQRKHSWRDDIDKITMSERGAIVNILDGEILTLGKLITFFGEKEMTGFMSQTENRIKALTELKNVVSGVKTIIPKEKTKPIIRKNAIRDWLTRGNQRQRQAKVQSINDSIKEILKT